VSREAAPVARIPVPDGDGTERSRVWSLAPAFADPVARLNRAVYEESRLPLRERELVRLVVARINRCPI
jgi:alkylhydroperoxidase family enzyme